MATIGRDPAHLRALVDMGSNGIRFSISNLSPPTARIVPTIYTDRAGISLYDAQYTASGERVPIPEPTIRTVLTAMTQFKRTCADFGVQDSNITILATEATRTAINSADYRQRIKDATGWEVTMLPKEEEGRVGAMGVASSLGQVKGLVMDLGGGSTQLTWLIHEHGELKMSDLGAVSMPFGAAALSRGMSETEKQGPGARQQFADDIKNRIKEAYASLKVPRELEEAASREGGFALYLSGGGFRGWGFVLLSQHSVKPYPIPLINGFWASRRDFMDTTSVQTAVQDPSSEDDIIFRVSQRRASQVPAVAFLVTALSAALPQIKEVRFCQGGVREGFLFSSLPPAVRSQQPLAVATQPLASPSADQLAALLYAVLPQPSAASDDISMQPAYLLPPSVLAALANTLNHFSTHPKDIRAASALRCTTTGFLASVHGLSHEERAVLALLLCERWGGEKELPPSETPFLKSLEDITSPWALWWVRYLGKVAALVGGVYPAGRTRPGEEKLGFEARWTAGTKKGNAVLGLHVKFGFEHVSLEAVQETFGKEIGAIGKLGKKKNWSGGKNGCGHKIEIAAGVLR